MRRFVITFACEVPDVEKQYSGTPIKMLDDIERERFARWKAGS